jgi:acyl-CoA reductase-like NAD-dependent aldehyde dehydrogenase
MGKSSDVPMTAIWVLALRSRVWAKDLEKAARFSMKLKAGIVWISSNLKFDPNVAFGGLKPSGIGAEHGLEGIKSY